MNQKLCVLTLALILLSFAISQERTSTPITSRSQRERTLTIRGKAVVKIPSPKIRIVLGVQGISENAIDAQTSVAIKIDNILQYLQKEENGSQVHNITDIQTEVFMLQPRSIYNNTERSMVTTGFTATNSLSFRVGNASDAGKILDEAVRLGANINSIQFGVDVQQQEEAEKEALTKALANAMQKAQLLVASVNYCLSDIVSLDAAAGGAPAQTPRPLPTTDFAIDDDVIPTTNIIPSAQEVVQLVTMKIVIMKCDP